MAITILKPATDKTLTLELRAAAETAKDAYPFRCECLNCGFEYGSHLGLLCPKKSPAKRYAELFTALKEREREIKQFGLVAGNEIPERAKTFEWRGTYFIPLIGGDNGTKKT